MIKFNEKDVGLAEISKATGLGGMATKFQYRVYGLKDTPQRPMIWIHYPLNHSCDSLDEILSCSAFFTNNGISTVADPIGAGSIASNGEIPPVGGSMSELVRSETYPTIYIGLSRAIRSDTDLCGKLLRTAIYAIEGRLGQTPAELENLKDPRIQQSGRLLLAKKGTATAPEEASATTIKKKRTTPRRRSLATSAAASVVTSGSANAPF